MKKAKVWSVLLAVLLLSLCVVGVLVFGASAAGETQWYVDGQSDEGHFSSIKEALDAAAAKSGTWAQGESLVITVDPTFLSSENVNVDKDGNSYGDLLFGVHTIFRANKTRLPITIQASGEDRTKFTLVPAYNTQYACANSYTFKDLTYPLDNSNGDANPAGGTVFYAGSGQVRFENVRLSTDGSTRARFGGDNFTKEAFVGWTQDHIDANAANGIITTSVTLGNSVSHVVTATAGGGSAAWLKGKTWNGSADILVTPQMTKTELVVDGATVGVLTSRGYSGSAVAESVLRIESGVLNYGVYGVGTLDEGNWPSYTGDMSIVINGGTFGDKSPFANTPSVRVFAKDTFYSVGGNVNLTINGGEFAKAISVSVGGNSSKTISKNLNITITDGDFNGTGNTVDCGVGGMLKVNGSASLNISGGDFASSIFCNNFYGSSKPTASYVKGDWTTNISGGTFGADLTLAPCMDIQGNITATISGGTFNGQFKGAPKTKSTIPVYTLNIEPHESGDASKNPVFNSDCYPGWFALTTQFNWNISAGTFKSNVIGCYTGSSTDNPAAMTNMDVKISGNPSFDASKLIYFGTGRAGTEKVKLTVEGSPSLPSLNPVYNKSTVGAVEIDIKGAPTITQYDLLNQGTCTGDFTVTIGGGTYGTSSNNALVFGNKDLATIEGNVTLNITGGTFEGQLFSYTVYGGGAAGSDVVKGNWTTNISGGTFKGPEGMTIAPHADLQGNVTANISGGTFNTNFRGAPKTKSVIPVYTINVQPHASGDASKNPVFAKDIGFYPVWFARATQLDLNISAGTFTGNMVAVYTNATGFGEGLSPVVKNLNTTISGTPTFRGAATCFGTGLAGTEKVTITVEGTPTIPNLDPLYNKTDSVGGVEINVKGNPTINTTFMSKGTVTGNVAINISGNPTTGNNFYAIGGGTVNGNVDINISGNPVVTSAFEAVKKDATVGGNLTTNITGNPEFRGYFSGVGGGTVSGDVEVTIENGTFKNLVSVGPINGGAVTGNVVVNVKGGLFDSYTNALPFHAIYGSGSIGGNYTLNVSGGIFNRQLYDNSKSYGSIGGNVETNITGGTFNSYFVGVPNVTMDDANATKTLTIKPENDIFFKYAVFSRLGETINLVGGDGAILLGASGRIQADAVTGNVTLKQTASWTVGNTYASFPAGHSATINVVTADGATGVYAVTMGEQGEILTVVGKKPAPTLSASMIITNRIALQMYFNREEVDALGDAFSYSFTMGEVVLKAGDKADFEEEFKVIDGVEFYVLNLPALGISQFDEYIVATLPGLADEPAQFSIASLAESAVGQWGAEEEEEAEAWTEVAKAIVNLKNAIADKDASYEEIATPEEVVDKRDRNQNAKPSADVVNFTQKTLLMSDAVGLRLYADLSDAEFNVNDLVVKVNGRNVSKIATITKNEDKLTVDIYFSVYGMTETFKVEISNKVTGDVYLTLSEQLDAMAQDLKSVANANTKALDALLVYLQKTAQLKKD